MHVAHAHPHACGMCMAWVHTRYFYRRLTRNPAYYHLEGGAGDEAIGAFLSDLVEGTLCDLENAGCAAAAAARQARPSQGALRARAACTRELTARRHRARVRRAGASRSTRPTG